MRSIEQRADPAGARTLVVFLPGRGSDARSFVKADFAAIAAERGLAADLVYADATEGYYFDRSVVTRLHDDIIGPARAWGYQRVWLVGVSLGGLGAILYARDHPDEIDGLLLLAPYLGDDALVREIERSGGLAAWPGPYVADGWSGFARGVWGWLRTTTGPGGHGPAIWIGYGRDDRLRRSHALLAAALAPSRVLTTSGGHSWSAWRALWKAFLASGALSSESEG